MGKRSGGKSTGGSQKDSRTKIQSSKKDFSREKYKPPRQSGKPKKK